jgi:single-stranded DNA-binding protein
MAENKRFTTYTAITRVVKDSEGKNKAMPFIIIEGNLTRDIELKSGKKANYVFTSIGTNVRAEEVYERAIGKHEKDKNYNDNVFFNLKFFGKTAERLAKIGTKGLHLVVWGNAEVDSYKANGVEKKSVSITVDNFIPIFKNSEKTEAKTDAPVAADGGYSADFEEPDDDEDIPF